MATYSLDLRTLVLIAVSRSYALMKSSLSILLEDVLKARGIELDRHTGTLLLQEHRDA